MECSKCGAAMTAAQFCAGMIGTLPYLMRKRPGAFESEHRCGLECFVCLKCGNVEFRAQDVQKLILS